MNNYIKEKQKNDLENGFKVEDVFSNLMIKTGRITKVIIADPKTQDMYEHWDRGFITKKGEKILFDVKGIKKFFINDINKKELTDEYHTLELLSVKGGLGWLFGKADYIAFELNDKFICVDRLKLLEYTLNLLLKNENKVKFYIENLSARKILLSLHSDLNIETDMIIGGRNLIENKLYKKYRRDNRLDITVDVRKEDILKLKTFEIKKNG